MHHIHKAHNRLSVFPQGRHHRIGKETQQKSVSVTWTFFLILAAVAYISLLVICIGSVLIDLTVTLTCLKL